MAPRNVPPPLWIVVFLLVLEGIGNFFMALSQPIALWWLIAKVLLISGLLRGWRSVFYLFLIVAGYHAWFFSGINPIAAGLNLLLIVATLMSWRHFFRGPVGSSISPAGKAS